MPPRLVHFFLCATLACTAKGDPPVGDAATPDGPIHCPAGHTVERVGRAHNCIDAEGRYDGPAVEEWEEDGLKYLARGQYRREAPDGTWYCENRSRGKAVEIEFDAQRWARQLWGVELDDIAPVTRPGVHLGNLPSVLCQPYRWDTTLPPRPDASPPDARVEDLVTIRRTELQRGPSDRR